METAFVHSFPTYGLLAAGLVTIIISVIGSVIIYKQMVKQLLWVRMLLEPVKRKYIQIRK